MPKKMLAFLNNFDDIVDLKCVVIDVNKNNSFKKTKTSYSLVETLNYHFVFHKSTTSEEINGYGKEIWEKLKEHKIENDPIPVILDSQHLFEGTISLPKLSGKALNDALEMEIEKCYGSFLDNFTYSQTQEVNSLNGYDFHLLFVENLSYNKLLDIFYGNKIKIDAVYYLPSLYDGIFDNNKNDEGQKIGIFIDDKETKFVLSEEGIIKGFSRVPVGVYTVNKALESSLKLSYDEVVNYRKENEATKTLKASITKTLKRLNDDLLIFIAQNSKANKFDHVYLNSIDGKTEDYLDVFQKNFPDMVEVYSQDKTICANYEIDAFFADKNPRYLPLKIKNINSESKSTEFIDMIGDEAVAKSNNPPKKKTSLMDILNSPIGSSKKSGTTKTANTSKTKNNSGKKSSFLELLNTPIGGKPKKTSTKTTKSNGNFSLKEFLNRPIGLTRHGKK